MVRFPLAVSCGLRDTVGMSAVPQPVRIPVEEYLATSYRPDCDYLDGEIEERNVGEFDHSVIQGLLFRLFLTIENPGESASPLNKGFALHPAACAYPMSVSAEVRDLGSKSSPTHR